MKVFYFTATGNNLYITKRLGGERYSIPKLLKNETLEVKDEQIGFVFPVHTLGVPSIVEKFLSKIKPESKYIFAVISYGNYAGAVATHLLKIGDRNGIEFSYINEILMVDNYLPLFDMRQQLKDEPTKNIEENLDRIINDINNQKRYIKKDSMISRWATKFARTVKVFVDEPTFDKKFSVEDGCISCGMCAEVCPVSNIDLVNKRPEFQGRCISCMACTNNCPINVIRLNGEKSKVRFLNQNVSSKEIMEANSK